MNISIREMQIFRIDAAKAELFSCIQCKKLFLQTYCSYGIC